MATLVNPANVFSFPANRLCYLRAQMPLFTDLSSPTDWTDPDEIPRPVVTIGAEIEKLDPLEMDFHHHAKSQFLLILKGVVSCEVEGGLWVVPPQSALWIPGGVLHSIKVAGGFTGYMALHRSSRRCEHLAHVLRAHRDAIAAGVADSFVALSGALCRKAAQSRVSLPCCSMRSPWLNRAIFTCRCRRTRVCASS